VVYRNEIWFFWINLRNSRQNFPICIETDAFFRFSFILPRPQLSDCLHFHFISFADTPGVFVSALAWFLQSCPAGRFSNSTGVESCTQCLAGFYCIEAATSEEPCASGYYSSAGKESCTLCPAGYQCSDKTTPVPCYEGEWSVEGETQFVWQLQHLPFRRKRYDMMTQARVKKIRHFPIAAAKTRWKLLFNTWRRFSKFFFVSAIWQQHVQHSTGEGFWC